ncbi:MAG: hypothetical protein QOH06_4227 [Acidobacteriota bacterium]|jgi:hypothetical protein|nr:hypothetical protein [Acidobacteriota bacterium]
MDHPSFELPLVSIRKDRARRLQKLQHAVPAVALLGAGAQRLMHGQRGLGLALAVGELVVSALLLRSAAKELAAVRRPEAAQHHHGVDWFDIFAAGVLVAEALEHWHHTGHLPRPTLVLAALTLAMGLFHRQFTGWIGPRRLLRIDEDGIRLRSRFRRQFFAPWPEVEHIDLDEGKARIVARGGAERRIDLADLRNASEVRQALLAAQERLASA